ncbi:MTH938/NDUFAF3 family protein [Uruburuella testudinis]|uniref:MTH938/NDUFAF3 family protein n=1 Tax=Uruburuella testudinis TaxID=1282863 RepID=A0ABY4DR82_9NEIS|nr:MTH938/NDUFAF3 family protein [Uruburuella testudinis]UOO80893.1 MTH938/NDUFAF3 family protein [Uruburuella testudinis]
MQIEESHNAKTLTLEGYTPGRIEISGTVHTEAVILQSDSVCPAGINTPAELTEQHLLTAAESSTPPEVILVGTGEKQIFLHPKMAAALAAKDIGLESMTTAAACRTYVILQSEGRRVWAWLWP